MLNGLNGLLDSGGLTAHGFCLAWQPGLIWLHAVSDILVAIAYYSIPIALAVIVRKRRDLAFPWVFVLFAAFIMACGTTHVFGALTLWVPAYWLEGVVKAITAVLSLATAVLLWPLIPKILAIPRPDELRRINAQLLASEARYRAQFTHAPAAMYSLDSERRITEVSDAWLDLFGYQREEVIGREISHFQDAETAKRSIETWPRTAEGGSFSGLERRMVCKSGEVLDVLLSVRVEQSDDDWRAICVVNDVTARLRAEKALRASEERLRQTEKLTALGQLAGGIAHDFNNILQTVYGGADLMRTRPHDAALVQRVCGMVLDAAQRGASVSRRLLIFARRDELRVEPVDIAAMLGGLQEVLAHTLGAPLEVRLDVPAGLPKALADRGQLETVLVNLATNARDAMRGGGTITIAARAHALGEAAGPLHPGLYVQLTVTDTGEGMDAETLARAVEPFFTTKANGAGTGLGLSMASNFAEQSGGRLTITSERFQGTTVALWLPAADEAGRSPQQSGHSDGTGPRRLRVLLVDDEQIVREIVSQQLDDQNIAVTKADSAATALTLLDGGLGVDVLVTDLSMPGMDGVALIEAARARRPGLPAVLLTGFSGKLESLPDPPPFCVLLKPVTGAALVREVRQMAGSLTEH